MWQPVPLLFPDVETLFVEAYRELLPWHDEDNVTVTAQVPKGRPPRTLVLTRDGGQVVGTRERVRLRMRVFDTSHKVASDLARKIVAVTPLLVSNGTVLRAQHLSGPLDVTEDGGAPQRYLLWEFDVRPIDSL